MSLAEKRDPKGLYKKARSGEIKNLELDKNYNLINTIIARKANIVKKSHIKCFFKTIDRYIDVMSFNSVGKPIGLSLIHI